MKKQPSARKYSINNSMAAFRHINNQGKGILRCGQDQIYRQYMDLKTRWLEALATIITSHVDLLLDLGGTLRLEIHLEDTTIQIVVKVVEAMGVAHIHPKGVERPMVQVACQVLVPGEVGVVAMELAVQITSMVDSMGALALEEVQT